MILQVATSQFPVSADICSNRDHIIRQLGDAKEQAAEVIHFPEGALSGYAGVDFDSFGGFDWSRLYSCTKEVMERARELGIWVLLGSAHRLTGKHKPHNSLYVIDDRGRLIDRYDKRFCAGDSSENTDDLAHYTPGKHFAVFDIKGICCGALICHDYRYPVCPSRRRENGRVEPEQGGHSGFDRRYRKVLVRLDESMAKARDRGYLSQRNRCG